jgi:hypothetical protein
MKMLTRLFVLAAFALLAPMTAHAQTVAQADNARPGLIAAGAFIGAQLDTPDDFLLFGGDGRLLISDWKVEISPRFSYQPIEDGSIMQIDLNVLKNYDLARPGKLRPYVGIGGALRKTSVDPDFSDTAVGLNLISGVRLAMSAGSGYEPFMNAQYTVIQDEGNVFSIVVGVSFGFRRN